MLIIDILWATAQHESSLATYVLRPYVFEIGIPQYHGAILTPFTPLKMVDEVEVGNVDVEDSADEVDVAEVVAAASLLYAIVVGSLTTSREIVLMRHEQSRLNMLI